ncbi:MAG: AAA family ATPase [Duncaniella sp.]|nr:AAA family ATPase [Duncaniella sp.]
MLAEINAKYNSTVEQIMHHIDADKSTGHIPQPIFLIGSPGAGKTTLLNELTVRLKDKGWERHLQFFDGKRFFNSKDLIKAIEERDHYENVLTEERDVCRRVVIVDDIDFLFQRSSFDDQYILRNYLYQPDSPLLIGTLSQVNDALADYRAPFFEGVRIIYVPSLDTVIGSLDTSEESQRVMRLLEYLPPVIRSLKIATDIISISDTPANDLQELVSLYEPIYRSRFTSLPVTSQKIMIALANSDGPLTRSQLRELTGISSGTLSPYLQQLSQIREIRKMESEKRGSPYEINDKLFKLWLSK